MCGEDICRLLQRYTRSLLPHLLFPAAQPLNILTVLALLRHMVHRRKIDGVLFVVPFVFILRNEHATHL
jgi:hypothetical protein